MAETLGRLLGRAHKYSFRRAERKFQAKPPNSVVTIHNLKSSRDEGILYPDDQLNDVADDREQIIAVFEENFSSLPSHNYGDGASTSSVCTGSPDIFSVEVSSHGSIPYNHSDVEITEDPLLSGGTTLQVRRGSEPALNCLFPTSPTDPSKRWSTAVVMNTDPTEKQENQVNGNQAPSENSVEISSEAKFSPVNFSRGSGRLSILGNNSETYRWVEAADRQLAKDLRGSSIPKIYVSNSCTDQELGSDSSSSSEEREITVILKNEAGPLGIHVVPDYDSRGRDTGLVIQGIETGGRIDRDGRFSVGDRITEISGQSLQNISFQEAQEVFKNALKTSQIKLELVKSSVKSHSKKATVPKKPPPPVYPKPSNTEEAKKVDDDSTLVEGEARVGGVSTKVATVTPTKKIPSSATRRLATANTRRIGKKISIQLVKGNAGLGFSITTRDNPAGGNSPIYIKNVLPKGAAIEDGQLQPGDRLLEVNGIEMTGKSQSEAVAILRNTPLGGAVNLVVSRQEDETVPSNNQEITVPPLKLEDETGIFPWKHREILTFQIPLDDSGSAGLGVSVKGKSTSTPDPVDLGIFVKSVIAGGAASKDGRLQTNDQLVNINGISLLGMGNSSAMETLRKAMTQLDGPIPNTIILTIARRIQSPSEEEQESSSAHHKIDNLSVSQGSSNCLSPTDSITDGTDLENLDNSPSHTNFENLIPSVISTDIREIYEEPAESDPRLDGGLPGSNPVIERLTGQVSSDRFKVLPNEMRFREKAHFVRNRLDGEQNVAAFPTTVNTPSFETVIIEDEYSPTSTNSSAIPEKYLLQQKDKVNACSEDIQAIAPAISQLSLDEINAGFARDGFGRQSMSEKRHAQLDARNTDTYQRNKKAREERERQRQLFEEEYLLEKPNQTETSQGTNVQISDVQSSSGIGDAEDKDDVQVGPSLGLRKSSSLESLQTIIQELNKDEEAKKSMHPANSRGSRGRGCNESFRAAVDRSYEAPAASTMETLDEESESGSSVGQMLVRSTEISDSLHHGNSETIHDDLLINMYCRNSKSKKKGLLKGLGSVFRFGKNRKSPHDFKGKLSEDGHMESDYVQHTAYREHERSSEFAPKTADSQKKPLAPLPLRETTSVPIEPILNRQERMQNLREQHQRLHQKRQGQYPLEQKEEYYENEIKEKEKHKTETEIAHKRSHSLDTHKDPVPSGSRHGIEANRYSHYMNYKEIQQHMNLHLHHDQLHRVPKLPNKSDSSVMSKHMDRPSSNYFEYESVQFSRHTAPSQGSESEANSLPRGSHITEQVLVHSQGQGSKHYYGRETHDTSGYHGRVNINHYYPNSALYSHVVPGSKV